MPSTHKFRFLSRMQESGTKTPCQKWQAGGPFSQIRSLSSAARRRLKLFAIHSLFIISLFPLTSCVHILKEKCLKSGLTINSREIQDHCSSYLHIDPKDSDVLSQLAISYFSARMPERARLTVRELLKLSDLQAIERVAYFLERVASLFVRDQQYNNAIWCQNEALSIRQSIRHAPTMIAPFVVSLRNMAYLQYVLGDLPLAKAYLELAETDALKLSGLRIPLPAAGFSLLKYRDNFGIPAQEVPGSANDSKYIIDNLSGIISRYNDYSFIQQKAILDVKQLRAAIYAADGDFHSSINEYKSIFHLPIFDSFGTLAASQKELLFARLSTILFALYIYIGDKDSAIKQANYAASIYGERYNNIQTIDEIHSLQVAVWADLSMQNHASALIRARKISEILVKYKDIANRNLLILIFNQSQLSMALGEINLGAAMAKLSIDMREKLFRASISEYQILGLNSILLPHEPSLYGDVIANPGHPQLTEIALQSAILHKGRTQDAALQASQVVNLATTDPALDEKLTALRTLQREQQQAMSGSSINRYELFNISTKLDQIADQIATAVPKRSRYSLPEADQVISAIAHRLPPRSVLIDIELAMVPNKRLSTDLTVDTSQHYVAFLLFPNRHIEAVDLGESASIDSAVLSFLSAMQTPDKEAESAARALHDQMFIDLHSRLTDVSQIYVVADGALSNVPFAALHDGDRYLLHRYVFRYLSSARDLLRLPSTRSTGTALLIANPDPRIGWNDAMLGPPATGGATTQAQLSRQLANLPPLPGAEREVEAVGRFVPAHMYSGADAKEEVLRTALAPWLLHIASHSLFFRDDSFEQTTRLQRSALLSLMSDAPKMLGSPTSHRALSFSDGVAELSASALVLAGAARGAMLDDSQHDGRLTALEAAGLNLHGTQLVVLSACETGRGTISIGQGVYGLRRGFLAAGAETVLASQWRVDDTATSELMSTFYEHLLHPEAPLSRLSALQRAMLETKQKHPHPHYWAPFVLIGEDGPVAPPKKR